jgi:hypothetical protein
LFRSEASNDVRGGMVVEDEAVLVGSAAEDEVAD